MSTSTQEGKELANTLSLMSCAASIKDQKSVEETLRRAASLLASQAETIARLEREVERLQKAEKRWLNAHPMEHESLLCVATNGAASAMENASAIIQSLTAQLDAARELAAGAKEHLAILLSDYEEKTAELGNYRQDYGAPVYVEEDGIKQDMREFLKRLDARLKGGE